MEKLILINGQWQGGGNLETYTAAMQIKRYYNLAGRPTVVVPVSTEADLPLEHRIWGCSVIKKQICAALDILQRRSPAGLLTVGGGCDADVASIAYLNQKYDGDLSVLWMDAHGDINAPSGSASHLFYGMPLRALLGEAPPVSGLLPRPLLPEQIVLFGSRDLDEGERRFIKKHAISLVPVISDEAAVPAAVDRALGKAGKRHLYVHLDLDVLAPEDFSDTPVPVPGGYSYEAVCKLLYHLAAHCSLVGMGIFEYKASGELPAKLRSLLQIAETAW